MLLEPMSCTAISTEEEVGQPISRSSLTSIYAPPAEIRDKTEAEAFAANFKRTFSRKVKVHFIGAWCVLVVVLCLSKYLLYLQGHRLVRGIYSATAFAADCVCFPCLLFPSRIGSGRAPCQISSGILDRRTSSVFS